MSVHAELLERHRAVLPRWLALYYEQPIELASGKGCRVTDGEGREYLDFFGGILTTMTGYAVPEVVEAIREQAGRMLHSSTLYLIRPMIELAEQIAKLSRIDDAKVFLTPSGSEANEAALLFATSYRRSNQVLALRNSYHGRGFATIAITGNRGWSASSLSPFQVSYVANGDPRHGPLAALPGEQLIQACVEDLRQVIETTTAGDVACLIAEPIQGVGGFITPPDGLYGAYKRVLDECGILFIADEVQTGWGRTGEHFWGIEAHGITPDLMTFAKGLGNGLSIGGVAGRSEIIDALPANHISTFGGNPLVCAGALANLRYLLAHDLQRNAAEVGALLRRRLEAAATRHKIVADVRGKGLMIGIELADPATGGPSPQAALAVMEEAKRRGLLLGRGGLKGNVLRVAPPLSLSAGEAEEGAAALAAAIEAAEQAVTQQGAASAPSTGAGGNR
jgi:4-aminobutyrate aminotransferase